MLTRTHTALCSLAAVATLSGCDVVFDVDRGEPPGASTGAAAGSGGASNGRLLPGSGGASTGVQLVEASTCTVPEAYQAGSYVGGEGGAGGATTEEAIDPESLKVGDGDLSVLVVFDKSGSMGWYWGDTTRFWAAHDALMRGVHHYIHNLTLAAILFPVHSDCGVAGLEDDRQIPWLQGYDFVDRWYQDLCKNQPMGGTPLYESLKVADTTIQKAKTLGLLEERFRVMVLTDGEETCDTTGDPIAFPAAWAEQGIETHVIGLPGSEAADSILREMAHVGGGVYTALPGTQDAEEAQQTLAGAVDVIVK